MPTAPHAITKLALENFRNYPQLTLEVSTQPVILTGHNGAGKTNILEAISLLSPGRGLRGAKLRSIDRIGTDAPWVVAAEVGVRGETYQLGTGRDPESAMEKRILKINGQRERKQAVLTQYICVQWLTPSLDQVFIEGGTARRKLLDRMTYGFDPEHAARVSAYEQAMRERNRLLAQGRGADAYWLSVLEQQMAEQAIAVTLARLDALLRIQETIEIPPPVGGRLGGGHMERMSPPNVSPVPLPTSPLQGEEFFMAFSRFSCSLHGTIETWLGEGFSALETEMKFAGRLKELRAVDGLRGRASEGPHRSHFEVMHLGKAMLAERCSTGEQKAILLALVIAAAIARARWCGLPPILLLDEVVAHLDVDKRGALFDLLRAARIQAWMTGTDAADFQGLEGFATHLEIAGGMVLKRVEI